MKDYHLEVPGSAEFAKEVERTRKLIAQDSELQHEARLFLERIVKARFGYQFSWLGVPVIRLPEDLQRQQEIMSDLLPELVIEIGVARGGGLVFACSIQEALGIEPNVVGVDNVIHSHTKRSIDGSRYSSNIKLFEGNSGSQEVLDFLALELDQVSRVLLILDSDHSAEHVEMELRNYAPRLPNGSFIIVCDTLIDELPVGTYPNREWVTGRGPGLAISKVCADLPWIQRNERYSAGLLVTEIYGGVLQVSR